MGALGQAAAVRGSFSRPERFWPLMTTALAGSGLLVPSARSGRMPSARWLGAGAGLGAAAYSATLAASILISRSRLGRRSLTRFQKCTASAPKAAAAALILPAALGEEWFWREGVISELLARGHTPGRVLGQATACYALVQAASLDPLPPAGAVLLGLVTGALRLASGSVWPALAAHVVFSEFTLVAPGLLSPTHLAGANTSTEL